MSFTTAFDIANRALQHLGVPRIANFSDPSKQAAEAGFCYDKLRVAELRRSVWSFAVRRLSAAALTSTQKRFIAPAWAVGTVYPVGSIVQDVAGVYWVSFVANTASAANAPGVFIFGAPQFWQQYFGPLYGDLFSSSLSYYGGALVYVAGSPDSWYLSLVSGNLAQTPPSASFWTQAVGASDLPVVLLVPASQSVTIGSRLRNAFPLPNGFLRMAPPDPRVENAPWKLTSAALRAQDFQVEGNFIISSSAGPLIFRYVADISDVASFDPLFCEGLAARMAYEMAPILTGSGSARSDAAQAYSRFMAEARTINRIEAASTESEEMVYDAEGAALGNRDLQAVR